MPPDDPNETRSDSARDNGVPDALAVAREVARAAGALLLEGFSGGGGARMLGRRQSAESKGSAIDLVTEYDRRAEALCVSRIRAAFPRDAVLAEEGTGDASGERDGGSRWIIDPLDGTTNFAHGLPAFCVSIAREVNGVVEVGVVLAPALGLELWARRGHGAFFGDERLAVSDTETLARSMLATGFPYDRHTSPESNFDQFVAFQKRAQAVRRVGSAALDLALVAHGTYDGYWEMKLKPWDAAAGLLLVEEAGGRVTGWSGEPASLERGALVASNGRVHDAMLAVLREVGVPPAARA